MNLVIAILAAAGFFAVSWRLLGAAVRVLTRGADALVAREFAQQRAQRGDLTGLQDANRVRQGTRRLRYRALGVLSIWAGLLVVPVLTPWPRLLYAAYSLLWLLPRRPRPSHA